MDRTDPDDTSEMPGIGDAAFQMKDPSMGFQSISFVHGDVKVVLNTIIDEIDLASVATAYATWLSSKR